VIPSVNHLQTLLNQKCSTLFPEALDFQTENEYCTFFHNLRCDKFYDSATISPSRTTSFGYGHKYDFTKESPNSPPPNTYNLKDNFSKDIKKGFGFG